MRFRMFICMFKGYLIALFSFIFSASVYAQVENSYTYDPAEEEHIAKHGGFFGDADDLYHYEVLVNEASEVVLYVNDHENKPIDTRSLEAQVTINPDGLAPVLLGLDPDIDGLFLYSLLPSDFVYPLHIEVEVMKNNEWVPMEFNLPHAYASADAHSAEDCDEINVNEAQQGEGSCGSQN